MPQLVIYLGALRRSRIKQQKSDASVYGVATDGARYMFAMITHAGILKTSEEFSFQQRAVPMVLGCVRYILEKTLSMSPNVSPKIGGLGSEAMDSVEDTDEDFRVGI